MVALNHFPCTSVHFLYYINMGTSGDPAFIACTYVTIVASRIQSDKGIHIYLPCLDLNSHLFDYPPAACFCYRENRDVHGSYAMTD